MLWTVQFIMTIHPQNPWYILIIAIITMSAGSLDALSLQLLLSLKHMILKFDEKHGSIWPDVGGRVVSGSLALESGTVTDSLDDTGNIGGDTQLAHLLGDGDVMVGQGGVVDDHVLSRVGGGLFEGVGGAGEQERVELGGEEGQEWEQS